MPLTLHNVAFDCDDPYALATFWSKVVDRPLSGDDHPGDPAASIELPTGVNLYFQRVPESKAVKNRVHVCFRPEAPRDQEVERVVALGATIVADRREPGGGGWVVLADPEGNEFCILRSAAEVEASAAT